MPLIAVDENADGETWDIAGPVQTASSNLANERVWLANGRKRLPLRASNRERMESEVRDFTAFGGHTDLRFERPIAVEYGQARKRLYTLTDDIADGSPQPSRWCLYAEDVSVPSNPVQIAVYRFVDICPYPVGLDCDHLNSKHWPAWDPIKDIKLWEGTGTEPDLIVARTRKRLVTIQLVDQNGTLAFHVRGWAGELFQEGRGPAEVTWSSGQPWFHDSAGFIDVYKIAFLIDVAVEQDQNGRLMAYALVESGAYGVSRPLAQMVIACDMDKAGGYLHPTFDADPGACVRYVVFDPLDDIGTPGTDLSAEEKDAHSAYHIDAYQGPLGAGTGTFLYVACGSTKQVQRVNVTNLFPQPSSGATCQASIILPPNTGPAQKLIIIAGHNMRHVLADPDAPGTRFVVLEQEGTHVWNNGSVVASSANEPNSFGPNRDAFLMKVPVEGGFAKHAWLALSNQVDHIGKVSLPRFSAHRV